MVHSFRAAVADARRHGDLYFAALLSQDRIEKAFGTARWLWQGWIYTPAVTVWVFLSQCLSPDHSCRDAVARLIAWRVARGLKPCSAETGAYCTARNDLPEEALHELVRDTGKQVEDESPETWLWHGAKGPRRGRLDHHHARHAGEPGGLSATEIAEARLRLSHCPHPGDLFALGGHRLGGGDRQVQGKADRRKQLVSRTLSDRLPKATWCWRTAISAVGSIIALLRQRGIDMVVRKHQLRPTDFRTGKRLGKEDHWSFGPGRNDRVDVGRAVRHAARRVDVARGPHPCRATGHAYESRWWW